jgi:glycine/D-amino acid oxidase-like deaminating enzyme
VPKEDLTMDKIKIAVVGGGAAGMFCAIHCAEAGAEVTLFERNEKLGRKLGITGKGRCNLTNNCESTQVFMQNVPRNPRFLYTALSKLSPQDLMNWFEWRGLELKTERGNRVFPVSDRAADVVGLLWRLVEEAGCKIKHQRVEEILTHHNKIKGLRADGKTYSFDKVILCTAADQNEHGYFSAKIAEAVLTAYLNYPANSCTVLSDPDGGYYEVSATLDGSSTTYTVDAIYGRVDVSLANSEPVPEEYNYDYFVDYGDNMFISDDPEAGLTEQ